MRTTYRICKTKYAATWFDGEGAFRYGGRWNSPGTRLLYTAGSLSLAALEMLVHLNDEEILFSYSYAEAKFDEKYVLPVEDFRKLPENWTASPAPPEIQKIGDNWVRSVESLILRVPTSFLPVEYNYLINLEHPDFKQLKLGEPQNFEFDERLK